MSNNSNHPKGTELQLLMLQRGVAKVLVGGKTIPFRGQTADATTLGPLIAAALGFFEDVHEKKSDFGESVATRDSQEPSTKQLIEDVKNGAVVALGESSSDFTDLGFKARKKPAELTPEQKTLKVQKLRATRAARNTVGSRKKLSIKGVVNPSTGNTPPAPGTTETGNGPATK
jgi:hypothetical protein